jgi:hypothetical protein
VEFATVEWFAWFNPRRLLELIGVCAARVIRQPRKRMELSASATLLLLTLLAIPVTFSSAAGRYLLPKAVARLERSLLSTPILANTTSGEFMQRTNHSSAIRTRCFPLASMIGILVLFHSPASATLITLSPTDFNTAVDNGPQDGIYDAFTPFNLGSVLNNGFTSFTTSMEFDISAIPVGSTINSATLSLFVNNFEGFRSLQINGYVGDGAVQLGDFAIANYLASFNISTGISIPLITDATNFVANVLADSGHVAGFNVKEDPPPASNFLIMSIQQSPTSLSIDYTAPVAVPEPTSLALIVAGLVTGGACRWRKRRRVPTRLIASVISAAMGLGGTIGLEVGPFTNAPRRRITALSFRPSPCSTRSTMRWLSMSRTLSWHASLRRKPAPYRVSSSVR